MQRCPIEACGRKFDNESTLLEHVKRRHAEHYDRIGSERSMRLLNDTQAIQDSINRLPKLKGIREASKERKNVEFYRRSSSKNKIEVPAPTKAALIMKESREIVQPSQLNTKILRRPSLNQKLSESHISETTTKQGELQTIKPRKLGSIKLAHNNSGLKMPQEQKEENFYTTVSDFKVSKHKPKLRAKSRESKLENNASQIMQPLANDTTLETEQLKQKAGQTSRDKLFLTSHKTIKRYIDKTKPINRVNSAKSKQADAQQPKSGDFEETVTVINRKINFHLQIPPTASTEYLYANNCNITSVNVNSLECLREISLQHNNIEDIGFLNFSHNQNLRKVNVDHNRIREINVLPPNITVFSASFNQIMGVGVIGKAISKCRLLSELDLSFNPIRKQPNYKLELLRFNKSIHKIDGMKMTKMDFEMMLEYSRLLDEHFQLIPSNKCAQSFCKERPSTAVSIQDYEAIEGESKTMEEVEKDIKKLTKVMRQTEEHLRIIKQENRIIEAETKGLMTEDNGEEIVLQEYEQLQKECESLELLNFLKFADEEELEEILTKKKRKLARQ